MTAILNKSGFAAWLAVVCLVTAGRAQQTPPAAQTAPTFRSAIDVIQIDVSVFDKERRPVLGLTEKDFTLLEDGKPQRIVAFAPVDLPEPMESGTEWKRSTRPDVATNEISGRRLVVIVVDDAQLRFKSSVLLNARHIVATVIDRLGPEDLASVVFTRDNRNAQDFTSDRTRLYTAMEKMSFGFSDRPYFAFAALNTLANVAQALIEAPEQRKVLVFVSTGLPVDLETAQSPQFVTGASGSSMRDREDTLSILPARDRLFREAAKANVNVYAFDPCGLRPARIEGMSNPDPCTESSLQSDSLLTIANSTGGHATLNTDNFVPAIERMFAENDSYYILGYTSSHPTGDRSTRRISVKVNRPDLTVRTRSVYDAESAEADAKNALPPSARTSIAGVLPATDLQMRASLAPFASPTIPGRAMVAITLGLQEPAPPVRTVESVELIAAAFDPEGKPRASQTQTSKVTMRPGAPGEPARYELVSQISLAPGRYRLRLGAHNVTRNIDGSVHADIDVPDFEKGRLALSGIVLSKEPPVKSALSGGIAILPVVPTTVRTFDRREQLTGLVRVYRGSANGNRPPPRVPVSLHLRILDPRDGEAYSADGQVVVSRMGPMYGADYRFVVPLNRLSIGDHLLIIEAQLDPKTKVSRYVQIVVK